MTREEIKEKAIKLLKDNGIKSIPIDINAICKKEKITVSVKDLTSAEKKHEREISGALLVRGNERNIFVNINDVPTRQRFTIAHELGHYFLHHNEAASENDLIISFRGERNEKEFEADFFAAELLMPEEQVSKAYKQLSIPFVSILATQFNVSNAAMRYRLNELGLGSV